MQISKKSFITIITGIICAVCVCCFSLFLFRKIPISRLWKQYVVVYVSDQLEESAVLQLLEAAGCRDVISLSGQHIPASVPLSPIEKESGSSSYLTRRNAYFFDLEHKFRLFYVPQAYENNAGSAIVSMHVPAGMDAQVRFPWVTPCISLLFFCFLCVFAARRDLFFAAGILLVLFGFSQPFAVNAASVCLALYSLYLALRFWRRRGAVHRLANSLIFSIFFLIPFFLVFSNSLRGGLLYVFTAFTSLFVLYGCLAYERLVETGSAFMPVLIRPASFMQVLTVRDSRYMLLCTGCIALLLCTALMSVHTFLPDSHVGSLYLPAPTRYADDTALPTIKDFVAWDWNVRTYPYRSLHETAAGTDAAAPNTVPSDGDKVSIPRYVMTEQGIQEQQEVVYTFDAAFRRQVLSDIDALPYPALEKLLKMQGNTVSTAYTSASGSRQSGVSLIALVIALFIPFVVFVVYTIFGRKKYDISF